MKKLLTLFLFIPFASLANEVFFNCTYKYDTDFHFKSKQDPKHLDFINLDPINESYIYDPTKETLREQGRSSLWNCSKDNWLMKCSFAFNDPTYHSIQTIEIGRKDLRYKLYRDNFFLKDRKYEGRQFEYKGQCRVIDENKF